MQSQKHTCLNAAREQIWREPVVCSRQHEGLQGLQHVDQGRDVALAGNGMQQAIM